MGHGENRSLGRWVSAQRKQFREFSSGGDVKKKKADAKEKTLQIRYHRLKDVGFRFVIGKGRNTRKSKSR